jgi:aminoglycoside phosphotransferase (APT) family kinase protein
MDDAERVKGEQRSRVVLDAFGVVPDAFLGGGNEASVYALDDRRVLRVSHGVETVADFKARRALLEELSRGVPFALPQMHEVGEVEGRAYAIERRFPGRSVMEELDRAEGASRDRLIEAYLDAAAKLGDLNLGVRPFGDLLGPDPVRAPSWRAYLAAKAAANLARSGWMPAVDPVALADALPDITSPTFVHLDAYAANMLTDGTRIIAVLDIGPTAVGGDRRFDPLSAAVYLAAPATTPVATRRDIEVAMGWLTAVGLRDLFEPVRRWLAAYWSFDVDDRPLAAWCRLVLGSGET